MAILWIIRGIIIASLFIIVGIGGFLLRNRAKYPGMVESKAFNIAGVLLYNIGCYLATGLLPPDLNVITPPTFFLNGVILFGFPIIGVIALFAGLLLIWRTLRQRKVVGIQNTGSVLITIGTYAAFRHPIYVGIICVSFAFALITRNWDGMLVFPLVVLLNLFEAKLEENYDLQPRFGEDYKNYQKKVRIFGPVWFWVAWILPVCILILVGIM